ncbi:hypothetical protein [Aeoliella mucimassa]|uniref:Uncharacterized protein n=1 Tax=Aeoliella mucimassa TaxID=2527972 RepID=A0A518ATF9_9BACT|nr:hypothetical protein [Aeoliella mucimassa]QDU58002.1 hypothetical protein Pan181_42270 [Aeoliella mucimassa]QDU58003.1 hypothetical protein Pan181_42280 [Aeoliella mucimassa]
MSHSLVRRSESLSAGILYIEIILAYGRFVRGWLLGRGKLVGSSVAEHGVDDQEQSPGNRTSMGIFVKRGFLGDHHFLLLSDVLFR